MRNSFFIFIFTALTSTAIALRAQAFENLSVGMGTSSRSQKAADRTNTVTFQNQSLFLHVPLFDERWIYQLEYHFLKRESREGILEIEYKRHEIQNWGMWKVLPNKKFYWLLGAGLNLNQEQVTSKLVGINSSSHTGDPYLSTGLQLAIVGNFFEKIMAQIALQYLYPLAREELDTDVLLTFRIGYNF